MSRIDTRLATAPNGAVLGRALITLALAGTALSALPTTASAGLLDIKPKLSVSLPHVSLKKGLPSVSLGGPRLSLGKTISIGAPTVGVPGIPGVGVPGLSVPRLAGTPIGKAFGPRGPLNASATKLPSPLAPSTLGMKLPKPLPGQTLASPKLGGLVTGPMGSRTPGPIVIGPSAPRMPGSLAGGPTSDRLPSPVMVGSSGLRVGAPSAPGMPGPIGAGPTGYRLPGPVVGAATGPKMAAPQVGGPAYRLPAPVLGGPTAPRLPAGMLTPKFAAPVGVGVAPNLVRPAGAPRPIQAAPVGIATSGSFVSVVFQPTVQREDVATFLKAYHVTIVAGPGAGRAYRIKLSSRILTNAELASVIASMKSQTALVASVVNA